MDKILKNKITILILGAMMVLTLGSQSVFAQSQPTLVVSPASLTKNVGDSFDLTVKVQPNGQKVCAVEGQLLLSKFTVQKINVASGIISQTPPSYSNGLYFLLGIPKCTTQETNLFTVRIKANSIGQATASFKKVDIIGEGKSVSSVSGNGNYKITILKVVPKNSTNGKKSVVAGKTEKSSVKSCVCKDWGVWQNKGCREGDCLETQMDQIRTRVCQPVGCDVERQSQCVNDRQCIASAKNSKQKTKNIEKQSFLASIGDIISSGVKNIFVEIVLGIIILAILVYLFYFLPKKKQKEK